MIIKDKLLNNTKNKQDRPVSEKIKYLIIHHTAGNAPGDFDMLSGRNTASSVSIHYYIGKDGLIWNLVGEDKIAYHTGDSNKGPVEDTIWGWNLNPISIGIELENYGNGTDEYTKEQIKSLEELSIDICKRNNIEYSNVLGHKEITTRKIDPSSNFYEGDIDGFREYIKLNTEQTIIIKEEEDKGIDNENIIEVLSKIKDNKENIKKGYNMLIKLDSKTLLIIIGIILGLGVLKYYGIEINTILELIK